MRRRSLALLALPVFVGAASCRATPGDCEFDSTERCLWEAGVSPPRAHPDDRTTTDGDPIDDPSAAEARTELDETLSQMIGIIGAGLEWPLVDARARELCNGELSGPEAAWTCSLGGLEINEQPLALEASDGVLSLSAVDLGDADSAALFEFAQRRFDGWCAGEPFKQFEGEALEEFYRCSLAEGPYLVIARFPRDLEDGRWQVSIAIVDAG